MFGQNKVVTPKRFLEEPEDTLFVTSVFPTLQGEGPYAGHCAVFVRLAYCNLQCSFCDTYFDDGERLSFNELESLLDIAAQKFPGKRDPLLVFTGGEPLMQENLLPFIEQLTFVPEIQVETNGNFYLPLPSRVTIVISPKINEKTHNYVKVNEDLLHDASCLKFVISETMLGYQDVPEWAITWRDENLAREIYVSPMNVYARPPSMPTSRADMKERSAKERISFWEEGLLNREENRRNHEYAAQVAMKYGCILTLQQHLYANLP